MQFGHVSCVELYPGQSHSLLGDKTSLAPNTGYVYGWIYELFIISIALIDLGSNNLFPTFFLFQRRARMSQSHASSNCTGVSFVLETEK